MMLSRKGSSANNNAAAITTMKLPAKTVVIDVEEED